jgi:hypothetical protein
MTPATPPVGLNVVNCSEIAAQNSKSIENWSWRAMPALFGVSNVASGVVSGPKNSQPLIDHPAPSRGLHLGN